MCHFSVFGVKTGFFELKNDKKQKRKCVFGGLKFKKSQFKKRGAKSVSNSKKKIFSENRKKIKKRLYGGVFKNKIWFFDITWAMWKSNLI